MNQDSSASHTASTMSSYYDDAVEWIRENKLRTVGKGTLPLWLPLTPCIRALSTAMGRNCPLHSLSVRQA